MKKVAVFFACILLSLNINAQHLKFKGVEITGALSSMVGELKKMGYELISNDGSCAILSGEFANEDCYLSVYATPSSKQVHTIVVSFEKQDNWYSLKADYLKYKKQLREKYNVIPRSTEEFSSPYYEGDGYELQALKKSKCFYFSSFKLEYGTIKVIIIDDHVSLFYSDSIGDALYKNEKAKSAYEDL